MLQDLKYYDIKVIICTHGALERGDQEVEGSMNSFVAQTNPIRAQSVYLSSAISRCLNATSSSSSAAPLVKNMKQMNTTWDQLLFERIKILFLSNGAQISF